MLRSDRDVDEVQKVATVALFAASQWRWCRKFFWFWVVWNTCRHFEIPSSIVMKARRYPAGRCPSVASNCVMVKFCGRPQVRGHTCSNRPLQFCTIINRPYVRESVAVRRSISQRIQAKNKRLSRAQMTRTFPPSFAPHLVVVSTPSFSKVPYNNILPSPWDSLTKYYYWPLDYGYSNNVHFITTKRRIS